MTALDGWENFYVIVGSSAGALIGLQFVVITLVADLPLTGGLPQATSAFTTPSVIHFGVVLFLSAIACAPWDGIGLVAIFWGVVGLCGITYTIIVTRRMRMQTAYTPVFEDWLFHALLPLAAYAVLVVSALVVGYATFGLEATHNPPGSKDDPAELFFVFGSFALLAAGFDVRMLLRGVSGVQRIARHLWRMGFALWIAASSLFLGQPQVFSDWLHKTYLLFVPSLVIPVLLIYWLIRTLFTKAYKTRAMRVDAIPISQQ